MRHVPRILALGIVVVMIAACAGQSEPGNVAAPASTIKITKNAWASFQEYRKLIGGQRTGAFLVAMKDDVGVAGVYTYCEKGADRCRSRNSAGPINHAHDLCKQHKLQCVLFARNAEIVARYEILP